MTTTSENQLILTRGIPASGKTTWAKGFVAQDADNRARVNRDDLRLSLFPGQGRLLSFEDEKIITKVQEEAVKSLLKAGKTVVVDDTNLKARYARKWYTFHDSVQFKDFPIDLETALMRNACRFDPIPGSVIRDRYNRYTDKGVLRPPPERSEVVPSTLKKATPWGMNRRGAYIFDIDGTLAQMRDLRGPYETDKYHLDELDLATHLVLLDLAENEDTQIILVSGRSEDHRRATQNWLAENGVPYGALLMRPSGDTRKDYIVKSEIYDKFIDPYYNVIGVFDDRNSVVAMWREKGLKCFQVQEGDF